MLQIPKEEEEINIGVRQQSLPAVAAEGHDRDTIRPNCLLLDELLVAIGDDFIDQMRSTGCKRSSSSVRLEASTQRLQAGFVAFPYFIGGHNHRHRSQPEF